MWTAIRDRSSEDARGQRLWRVPSVRCRRPWTVGCGLEKENAALQISASSARKRPVLEPENHVCGFVYPRLCCPNRFCLEFVRTSCFIADSASADMGLFRPAFARCLYIRELFSAQRCTMKLCSSAEKRRKCESAAAGSTESKLQQESATGPTRTRENSAECCPLGNVCLTITSP